jgi:hypothetical protein
MCAELADAKALLNTTDDGVRLAGAARLRNDLRREGMVCNSFRIRPGGPERGDSCTE